jgi:hypothetical protein
MPALSSHHHLAEPHAILPNPVPKRHQLDFNDNDILDVAADFSQNTSGDQKQKVANGRRPFDTVFNE